MSKVISFSISDRYLNKIRSLYPELTENLAAKQFLIDQLDAGLDNNLDDEIKILANRLEATEKSISKWILAFDDRIKDIDREIKDRSIAIEHRVEKIEARLDDSLDKTLDDSLDESLDSSLYEGYSEIFIDRPDENLDDILDTKLNDDLDDSPDKSLDDATIDKKQSIEPDDKWLTLQEILGQRRKNWPKSAEGLRKKAIREGWPQRIRENRKEYQIPK